MYVQDLKLGINATAEIPKQEANNFKEMCQVFAAANLHDSTIDEYLLKLSQARAVSSKSSHSGVCPRSIEKPNYEFTDASLNSIQRFKNVVSNLEKHANSEEACSSSGSNISTTYTNASGLSISNGKKRLEDAIKVDEILKSTIIEMNLILERSNSRIQSEQEIIEQLSFLLTAYDSSIAVVPFGSTTYGFGGKRTNFNILVITGCAKLLSSTHLLEFKIFRMI